MIFTANQILAHLFGDYVIQSDWMAQEKTKHSLPAFIHALTYGSCFLFITHSVWAISLIVFSHFLIDRFRLARYVLWLKNQVAPKRFRYELSEGLESGTGYKNDSLAWLAVWLMIIGDNSIHILINALAVYYLS